MLCADQCFPMFENLVYWRKPSNKKKGNFMRNSHKTVVDRPTQLICTSDISFVNRQIKRHSRAICYSVRHHLMCSKPTFCIFTQSNITTVTLDHYSCISATQMITTYTRLVLQVHHKSPYQVKIWMQSKPSEFIYEETVLNSLLSEDRHMSPNTC